MRRTRVHPFRRNVFDNYRNVRSSRIIFQSIFGKRNAGKSSPTSFVTLYMHRSRCFIFWFQPVYFVPKLDDSVRRNLNMHSLTYLLIYQGMFLTVELYLFFFGKENMKSFSIHDRLILVILLLNIINAFWMKGSIFYHIKIDTNAI